MNGPGAGYRGDRQPFAIPNATTRAATDRIRSGSRGTRARALLVLALAVGCTRAPLLERAIRARGGSLTSVARTGEARVQIGFPGSWHWRAVYLAPDVYALSVDTSTEPYHYLFDGTTVRVFAGARAIATDPRRDAPLQSQARFTAVANLDALRLPRYRVAPLAPGELGGTVHEGLVAVEIDTGGTYRLGFDARHLLVRLTGPLDLDPLGHGDGTARFDDFRSVGGLVMPFRTTYGFGDTPLIEDRTTAICPNLGLTATSFRDPAGLPGCGGWASAQ
jgi:hypothetical protein